MTYVQYDMLNLFMLRRTLKVILSDKFLCTIRPRWTTNKKKNLQWKFCRSVLVVPIHPSLIDFESSTCWRWNSAGSFWLSVAIIYYLDRLQKKCFRENALWSCSPNHVQRLDTLSSDLSMKWLKKQTTHCCEMVFILLVVSCTRRRAPISSESPSIDST